MAGSGSGARAQSVNIHSAGSRRPDPPPRRRRRALTWRAHATSLLSMQNPDTLPDDNGTVLARLAQVQARIAAATAAAGRPPGSVALVAVSKTHPRDAVLQAMQGGQLIFGENRVQEAAAKFAGLRADHPDLRLHIIGGLQTNKARDAVRIADVIESLDRPRLADAIADAIAKEGRAPGLLVPSLLIPSLLIQVNVGDEPQKAGIARADADEFIESCKQRFGQRLAGLMCVPPAEADPAPHFAWLAACAARHGLATLSMGMSGDYEAAIRHGATHVRLGSAIFGSRPALSSV